MSPLSAFLKRGFDLTFSFVGLLLTGWIILLAYCVATLDTGKSGFFARARVGRHGRLFKVIKIRTMREWPEIGTTVTVRDDPRITRVGHFFRNTKIDELPQLINVLLGQMSFVGPRPDVVGFADSLEGDNRIVLSVRPGITGPATLKYRNEEELLLEALDPEEYNRDVIFPDKVRINRDYIENYRFLDDIRYICWTLWGH